MGFDFFTTTLSISPKKDEQVLNAVAKEVGAIYGIKALPADFKKKGGNKRSIELSAEYDLYRQDYCGCAYSLRDRDAEKADSESAREG